MRGSPRLCGRLPGLLREHRYRPGSALDAFQEALTDLRQAHSPDLGGALLVLSDVLARLGDFEASQEALAEALPLVVEKGDPWDVATHDMFSARNLAAQGRAEEAEHLTRASVDRLRACGDHWMILYGLGMLAGIEESHGDFPAATAGLRRVDRGVPVGRNGPLRVDVADPTGHARARLGDDVAAERLFADPRRHQLSIGQHRGPRRPSRSGPPTWRSQLVLERGSTRPTPTMSPSAFPAGRPRRSSAWSGGPCGG